MRFCVSDGVCLVVDHLDVVGRQDACDHPDGGQDRVPVNWQTRSPLGVGSKPDTGLGKPERSVSKRHSCPGRGQWPSLFERLHVDPHCRRDGRNNSAVLPPCSDRVASGSEEGEGLIGPGRGVRTKLRDGGGMRDRERGQRGP